LARKRTAKCSVDLEAPEKAGETARVTHPEIAHIAGAQGAEYPVNAGRDDGNVAGQGLRHHVGSALDSGADDEEAAAGEEP
jgi:hypothetical protein